MHVHYWQKRDPDPAGRPRGWSKPWKKIKSHTGKESQVSFPDKDPILRIASSAEHPTKSTTQLSKMDHSILLGYFWNLKEDSVSTNTNLVINLMPASKGQVRRRTHSHLGQPDLFILVLLAEQHSGLVYPTDSQQSSGGLHTLKFVFCPPQFWVVGIARLQLV